MSVLTETIPALRPAAVGDELLDDPAADPAVVAQSLHHIARANRWFGGTLALTHGLRRLLADVTAGTRLTLLDLGTGDGDLPRTAARWAARRGIVLVPLGLERSPVAVRLAVRNGVPSALADAGAIPFADGSVDLVLMNLFVHHFAPDSIVQLLREAARVARHGLLLSDLQRSGTARALFAVGSRLLGFDAVTREDGDTSIRRGFTRDELAAHFARAGLGATVEQRPLWRLVATARVDGTARATA